MKKHIANVLSEMKPNCLKIIPCTHCVSNTVSFSLQQIYMYKRLGFNLCIQYSALYTVLREILTLFLRNEIEISIY